MDVTYHWVKAFHIIAVISWMAGMLYLPRLYAYHCRALPGSETSELFKVMERRLLRIIINPAMVLTWGFGIWLAIITNAFDAQANGYWLHYKLGLVILMQIAQAFLARWRRAFARDERPHSEKFFRIVGEVPAVLMIGIVILAVVKPL